MVKTIPVIQDVINSMKKINIGELVLNIPIIQGGMGIGVSMSGLAAAVANEGGVGTISGVAPGFREPDFLTNFREANMRGLAKEIQKARELTKGILAVNIMVALTNFADMVQTAIKEKIDVIISGAGLALNLPEYRPADSKTKLVPIVSTDRALNIIIRKWLKAYNCLPDAVVLESPYSGGHQGVKMDEVGKDEFNLDQQLPKVLALLEGYEKQYDKKIPVFVAGGVQTGADIRKYVEMGAAGAQIGTRFITTDECDASLEFKNQYLAAQKPEDIVVIPSPVGLPLRVIKTKFVEDIMNGVQKPIGCYYKCLHTCDYHNVSFCIASALINAQSGKIDEGVCCSGVNGYLNNEILSVHDLMNQMQQEYQLGINA
ncbi:MAG: nitronate monooxygenase [Candidatus Cloacimonetes bacterium HGW-Cloacimonetes-1]|jgi:NAD(P)H-dependent flavin oxidoreductase YrpB (nitropropane dioxygenase family)|nr:MAG: nitronate monooxygenase [Candidatus Cloacimonetes bacterium HGW-Cloacimonetes-1]